MVEACPSVGRSRLTVYPQKRDFPEMLCEVFLVIAVTDGGLKLLMEKCCCLDEVPSC